MRIRWTPRNLGCKAGLSVLVALATVACNTNATNSVVTGTADGAVTQSDTAGGSDTSSPGQDAAPDVPPPPPPPVVDLVVDANRDGVANPDDPADQVGEETWSDKAGASYLPNLDDDDGDKTEDARDVDLDGPDDELDLARVKIKAWPTAPDGAYAKVTIDLPEHVRVYQKLGDGTWLLAAGVVEECTVKPSGCESTAECQAQKGPCTTNAEFGLATEDLRKGIELGVEGMHFRWSAKPGAWSGDVKLTLTVLDQGKPVATADAPNGTDTVNLRVAPWILLGNTSEFDEFRSANYYSAFVKDLKTSVTTEPKVKYTVYGGSGPTGWNDQWTQDFYQTGFTAIPAPGGKVQGMRILNARPWGRYPGQKPDDKYLPITWLRKAYIGKDKGILAIYNKPHFGSTFDSHGNHDLLPPYVNGDQVFPVGRIIHGSKILPETKDFYDAQRVQGPSLEVPTSWLAVGHVDEVFSYAPAGTPRGWKLLMGSNDLAKKMFEDLQKAGHGAIEMFVGKDDYKGDPAAVSIDKVLANVELMKWSQEAQAEAKAMLDVIQPAVGVQPDEIVLMPYLTEDVGDGKLAYNPGTANSLLFYDHIAIPHPFGPIVDGKDVMAKDLHDRLGTGVSKLGKDGNGMKVYLIDDFESYHNNMGEVHCGTNPEAPPLPLKWWEVPR